MPLPVATCADEVPTDACCTTLFDVANRLRSVVTAALCECFEGGCADREFRSFVSVGPQIEDPLGDCLIVHMPRITVSALSNTAQGALLPVAVHVADFEIRLLETGWPMIEINDAEEMIYIPDSEFVNAMARHVYSHGERMYRAIVDGIQHNTLFTMATSDVAKIRLADFTPIQPSGELAGWTVTVQVELTFPPHITGS